MSEKAAMQIEAKDTANVTIIFDRGSFVREESGF